MSVLLCLALLLHLGQVLNPAKINKSPVQRRVNKGGQTSTNNHIRVAYNCSKITCKLHVNGRLLNYSEYRHVDPIAVPFLSAAPAITSLAEGYATAVWRVEQMLACPTQLFSHLLVQSQWRTVMLQRKFKKIKSCASGVHVTRSKRGEGGWRRHDQVTLRMSTCGCFCSKIPAALKRDERQTHF